MAIQHSFPEWLQSTPAKNETPRPGSINQLALVRARRNDPAPANRSFAVSCVGRLQGELKNGAAAAVNFSKTGSELGFGVSFVKGAAGTLEQLESGAINAGKASGKTEPKESMPSKNTRIAYLKRMLKRLDGEEVRVQQLVSTGELSPEGGELTTRQVTKSRRELLSELQKLEGMGNAEVG